MHRRAVSPAIACVTTRLLDPELHPPAAPDREANREARKRQCKPTLAFSLHPANTSLVRSRQQCVRDHRYSSSSTARCAAEDASSPEPGARRSRASHFIRQETSISSHTPPGPGLTESERDYHRNRISQNLENPMDRIHCMCTTDFLHRCRAAQGR